MISRTKRFSVLGLVLGMSLIIFVGCGAHQNPVDLSAQNPPQQKPVLDENQNPVVVVGRYEVGIAALKGVKSALKVENVSAPPQDIGAVVGTKRDFKVDGTHFITPTPGSGVTSYGTLDVTVLLDNNLRVCGAGGSTKCTSAGLRIYSSGTPGAGLWNDDENYGLPISSDAATIGLNAAGAVVLDLVGIGPHHVFKLCYFTQTSCDNNPLEPFKIPVAVDFADAAAGTYHSKLMIEYFLQ